MPIVPGALVPTIVSRKRLEKKEENERHKREYLKKEEDVKIIEEDKKVLESEKKKKEQKEEISKERNELEYLRNLPKEKLEKRISALDNELSEVLKSINPIKKLDIHGGVSKNVRRRLVNSKNIEITQDDRMNLGTDLLNSEVGSIITQLVPLLNREENDSYWIPYAIIETYKHEVEVCNKLLEIQNLCYDAIDKYEEKFLLNSIEKKKRLDTSVLDKKYKKIIFFVREWKNMSKKYGLGYSSIADSIGKGLKQSCNIIQSSLKVIADSNYTGISRQECQLVKEKIDELIDNIRNASNTTIVFQPCKLKEFINYELVENAIYQKRNKEFEEFEQNEKNKVKQQKTLNKFRYNVKKIFQR